MNMKPFGCLVLVLAASPLARAQAADVVTPVTQPTPTAAPEDAQAKALREQVERELAARKAEADALIAADIAKNPDGANAIAARKAAEAKKTAELDKQTADEKAQSDAKVAADAAAAQAATDRKAADAAWAAGAPERARVAATKKAAVEKWRSSGKGGPSILMGQRSDGTFTVMVDGKLSKFATEAEAQAFADKARSSTETTLSY